MRFGIVAVFLLFVAIAVFGAAEYANLTTDCDAKGGVLVKGASLSGYVCVAAAH